MIIQIWDLPLRLFHWLLVASVVAAYVTSELSGLWLDWHILFGEFIIALIVFRIVWGFMGSTYARFRRFIPSFSHIRAYITSDWSGIGHNPLGTLSIFSMLGVILAEAFFGLFVLNEDIEFHGPFYDLVSASWVERLSAWHKQMFNILLILIAMHLIAITYYSWFKNKNLITPMITGKICIADNVLLHPIRGGGKIQFLLAIAIAAIVFWCLESGALSRWISSDVPDANSTIILPSW